VQKKSVQPLQQGQIVEFSNVVVRHIDHIELVLKKMAVFPVYK
jgi:hypothetical protein